MGLERYASLPCRSYDTRCEAWLTDLLAASRTTETKGGTIKADTRNEAAHFDAVLNQVFVRLGLEIETNPIFQDLWVGLIMSGLYQGFPLDPRFVRLASAFALQLAQKPLYLRSFPDPTKRREALLEESLLIAEWMQERETGSWDENAERPPLKPSHDGRAIDYVSNQFLIDLAAFYDKEIPSRVYFTTEHQVQYRKFSLTGGLPDPFSFWTQLFIECVGFRAAFFFDHANSESFSEFGHVLFFASDSSTGRLKTPLWFLECLEDWSESCLERFEHAFIEGLALWTSKYRALFGRDAVNRILEGILHNPSLHDQEKGACPERWIERYKGAVRKLWEDNASEDPAPRLVALRGVLSHEGSSVSLPIIQALADENSDDVTAPLLNETLDYFYAENLGKLRKEDDIGERYLGLVFYGLELELEIQPRHLAEASEVAQALRLRGEYLAKWDDPEARSRALQWEEKEFRDSITQ